MTAIRTAPAEVDVANVILGIEYGLRRETIQRLSFSFLGHQTFRKDWDRTGFSIVLYVFWISRFATTGGI